MKDPAADRFFRTFFRKDPRTAEDPHKNGLFPSISRSFVCFRKGILFRKSDGLLLLIQNFLISSRLIGLNGRFFYFPASWKVCFSGSAAGRDRSLLLTPDLQRDRQKQPEDLTLPDWVCKRSFPKPRKASEK